MIEDRIIIIILINMDFTSKQFYLFSIIHTLFFVIWLGIDKKQQLELQQEQQNNLIREV